MAQVALHHDDPTISDGEELWRYIRDSWVIPDDNRGGFRVSSMAFLCRDPAGHASVFLASLARDGGRGPEDIRSELFADDWGMAAFQAGKARGLGFGVLKDNEPPKDEAHGLLVSNHASKGKCKRARSTLARDAVILLCPPGIPS